MNRLNRAEDRGTLAVVLCGASLAILAILIVFGDMPEPIKSVAIVVVPILWVAGVLALTPLNWSRDRGLAALAVVAYAIAFALPAATANSGTSIVWGFQAFVHGITVVPVAWFANLAFVVALELRRRMQDRTAPWACAIAVLLALTAPLTLPGTLLVSVGFFAWAVSMAVLAVALLRQRSPLAGVAPDAAG